MKKILVLLLAICLSLTLVGCGSSTDTATDIDTEEKTVYHIGVLQYMQHAALDKATEGFKAALVEEFGEDGVVFDDQDAAGDATTCNTVAQTFVSNQYDLLFGNATPAVISLINATQTIPVVGTSVTDYSSVLGTDSLNDEGTTEINLTGTSDGVDAQLYVDCLLEVVPEAKKVGILYCSAEPNSKVQAESFEAALKETAPEIEVTTYTFSESTDLQGVAAGAASDNDVIYIPTDNTCASNMPTISNETIKNNTPIVCGEESMCKSGGAVTVSISYYDIGYIAGQMAAKILNGADPATMPIQYATSSVGEYNPDYCAEIGLTVPDSYTAIDMSAE